MPARRREPLAREEPAELQVAATNGSIVTDSRGRKYIDFVMGWCVGNFGWRPVAIAKAIERFKGPDYVYPGYAYAPWTELARLLTSLAPRPLTTCFRATGGSEAVDLATTRTPSTTSAVAMGCSYQPKGRQCCCCRRWRSTSGPPREDWTSWRARYDAPRRPAANPRVQLGASLRGQSRGRCICHGCARHPRRQSPCRVS
jgi:Aminotransferase class-III